MVDSPCNDICTIDSVSGLCEGCGRTPSEITNWIRYSDNQKKAILNSLKNRRNNIDNMLDNRIMNNLFNAAKKQIFPIGLILILTLSRIIPHPWNFTPVIAVAIMSGYFFKNIYFSFSILLISMFVADLFLGFYENMIFVYISLLLISFIFYKISKRINFKNLFIYGFAGSVIFFVISNFGVWALGSPGVSNLPYDKTLSGLIECYVFAIPFFPNTFLSTLIFSYPAIYIYKSLPSWSSSR
tara:strand:- start:110 stop:832 length:723 start_codon:yes stop_codon:yes gene_type:complete